MTSTKVVAGTVPRLPDVSVASAEIWSRLPGPPKPGPACSAIPNGAERAVNASVPLTKKSTKATSVTDVAAATCTMVFSMTVGLPGTSEVMAGGVRSVVENAKPRPPACRRPERSVAAATCT